MNYIFYLSNNNGKLNKDTLSSYKFKYLILTLTHWYIKLLK